MSDAIKNPNSGTHNGHWTTTATKSGTYEFATGGKFVDRNIDLVIPQAAESVSGTGSASVTAGVSGAKNDDGQYLISGTGTISGTATAKVDTKGFTDSTSYTGSVSGTATASGTVDPIGLSASGSGSVEITTVTVGSKNTQNRYPITGSNTGSGTAAARVTSAGYGTIGHESGSGTVSVTGSLNSTLPAASATVRGSGTASAPSIAKQTSTAKSGSITKTKPSEGTSNEYYVAVKATAPATTVTTTTELSMGWLGNKSEITASGEISAKTGDEYYVPITKASVTKGKTTINTSTKEVERGTFDVSEGYITADGADLAAATFTNTPAENTTYVDISDYADAPILISGNYLYINQGYTDNLKISLAKLVPDPEDPKKIGASGDLLSGKILYDNDGKPVTGTIKTNTKSNVTVSGKNVEIPVGYYATAVTKSVADGSIQAFAVTDSDEVATFAKIPDTNYYAITSAPLHGTVNINAGWVTGGDHAVIDSDGAKVGKVAASTTSGDDKTATATASATITPTFASGTTRTTAGTGYTKRVVASASSSVADTSASKTVGVGYVGSQVTATATVTGASKSASSELYILDGIATINQELPSEITSSGEITSGKYIKVAKGYYTTDKFYKAQEFTQQAITGSLSTSITSGYTAPTLIDTAKSGTPYVTISGNGSMTTGNQYNGTANAKTQYMEVYAGTFSIT